MDGGGAPRPIAWVDGRVLPASEATVPLTDEGVLRGDGVFEAVLVRGGQTHALDAHLARLRRSAKAMNLRVPVLRQLITDLLAAWGDNDGALRIVLTRGGTVRGILSQPQRADSVSLQPMDVPWRTALSGVKTLSYAVNSWATRRAVEEHADDALIVTDGTVQECPTAAFCWVAGARIMSSDPRRLPILESVTLTELGKVVEVERTVASLEEVLAADEAFIVSATRPVVAVHAIGEVELPSDGPVTTDARQRLLDHIEATLDPLH